MSKVYWSIAFLLAVGLSTIATPATADAICEDGSYSSADGQGACSHHGGVDEWLDGRGDPDTSADDVAPQRFRSEDSNSPDRSGRGSGGSTDNSDMWLLAGGAAVLWGGYSLGKKAKS